MSARRPVTSVHLGDPRSGTWLTWWLRVAVQVFRKIPRLVRGGGGLARSLRRTELRLYRALPVPDLVVKLNAPIEVTVSRNAARERPKPERLVRASHARAALLKFPGAPEVVVDSTAPLDATIIKVHGEVEALLASRTFIRAGGRRSGV
jgi:hypothetical protein